MASAEIKIDSKRPRRDGTCAIHLQVIIYRKKINIGLDIAWPSSKFDNKVGCKPRFKDDPDVNDYNIIIGNARTKANEIFKFYRVRDLPLNLDVFKKDYYSNLNKSNFVEYYRLKSFDRNSKKIISDITYKMEKATLIKLVEFTGGNLPFNSLNNEWAHLWDTFLKKKYKNDINTRWAHHKRIKTYLRIAYRLDSITFIDPYSNFKVAQKKSKFKALSQSQFRSLVEYYYSDHITTEESFILRRFLFCCCTGLRISDVLSLTPDNFKGNMMSLSPKKTTKFGTHIDSVPINDMAYQLLNEEKSICGEHLFKKYTEQYGNRTLKVIAGKLNIDHNIHNHIARSTFASLYDQSGGNHRSLMEYMGLTKMETLMKYVHTNKEVIASDVEKMNKMINLQDNKNLTTL